MEEPQPSSVTPMETENQEIPAQPIPENQPQTEPEPLQPENQPDEPNEPDNLISESDQIQVESIEEEAKPEVMETESEPLKELIEMIEEPVIVEKENNFSNEEIDNKGETLELAELEPAKTINTTIVDETPDDLKEKVAKVSHDGDNIDDVDTEEAMRELDELFNSGDDTTKDPITPPKETGEAEEKENQIQIKTGTDSQLRTKDFASQPSGSKKGKETPVSVNDEEEKHKKQGKKKLTKLLENQSPTETEENLDPRGPLFELNAEKKFKLPNKGLSIHQLRERYNDIIYHFRCESEVACLVCLDEEASPEDDIIICDLCSSAFHQSCYGGDLLQIAADDESEWHCQRCAHLLKNNVPAEAITCTFCPELKGPMKRVRNNNANEWAHMVCVNWIPEIYYQDEREKANVYITEYKASRHCGRKNLICTFCKLRYGDCIQCDTEKCSKAFHVTCAQKHGLICNWKEMKGMKRDQDTEFYTPIYCKHHMQLYSEEMFDFSNMVEARNESRGVEVSLLLDPATISRAQSLPKRSHQAKKRVKEIDQFVEKEYGDSEAVKSFSPGTETKKRRSQRARKQIEEDRSEEERKAFKARGRTAKKSVTRLDEETPYDESAHRFDSETHYEEKSRREHSGSKKEIDSSFISTGRVLPHTYMEEEEQKPAKSTPIKARKQAGGIATDNKPEANSHKKEKTEKKKREKTEHVEKTNKRDKPDKTAKEEKVEKKESSGGALYKFRPNMAKLLRFNGWGTEKEIKTVISDYIKAKGLYRKEDEEVDIAKDSDLEEIMGLERVSRKQIFAEFLHFMLKKSPEEVVREDNDTPFISLYEEEYKREKAKVKEKDRNEKGDKMNEEDKQGERKIKKKAALPNNAGRKEPVKEAAHSLTQSQPSARSNKATTHNTTTKQTERPFQQIYGKEFMGWQPAANNNNNAKPKPKPQEKESDLDFFEWSPKHNENKPSHHPNIVKPISHSQNIQKSHVFSAEEKEPPILKKIKINTSPPKTNTTVFSSLFANKEDRHDRQDRQDRPDRSERSERSDRLDRHDRHEHHPAPAPVVLTRPKKNDAFESLGPLISKVDKMPFRRNMTWFVKTDSSLAVSSINSQAARERFWPKGADLLF